MVIIISAIAILTILVLFAISTFHDYPSVVTAVLAQKETAPIANAGPDQIVHANEIITLNGNNSFDSDGDPILGYHWSSVGWALGLFVGPGSSYYGYANGKIVQVQIPNVDAPRDISIQLTVSDGKYNSNPPDTVVLHVLPMGQ